MKLLPVALNIEGKRCLVVGGGAVALRKVKSLLECGAHVTVVAPKLSAGFAPLRSHIEYWPRGFEEGDCDGVHLIFACTNDQAVNAGVRRAANKSNVWCNIADDPEASNLHGAATLRRGEICIGITTGGGSPALARHLKTQLENCIGTEYEELLEIMSARRAVTKQRFAEQRERANVWCAVLDSKVLSLLREGRRAEAETLVDAILEKRFDEPGA